MSFDDVASGYSLLVDQMIKAHERSTGYYNPEDEMYLYDVADQGETAFIAGIKSVFGKMTEKIIYQACLAMQESSEWISTHAYTSNWVEPDWDSSLELQTDFVQACQIAADISSKYYLTILKDTKRNLHKGQKGYMKCLVDTGVSKTGSYSKNPFRDIAIYLARKDENLAFGEIAQRFNISVGRTQQIYRKMKHLLDGTDI